MYLTFLGHRVSRSRAFAIREFYLIFDSHTKLIGNYALLIRIDTMSIVCI